MSTPYVGNSILSTKTCDHAVCAMTTVIVFLGYSAVYEILLQSGKVAQWVKVLPAKYQLMTQVSSLKLIWWKEKTGSHKFFSAFHTSAMHVYVNTHMHTHIYTQIKII